MTDKALARKLLEEALERSGEPTVFGDADGRVVFCNAAALDRLGAEPTTLEALDPGWARQPIEDAGETWTLATLPLPGGDLWPEHADRLIMLGTLLSSIAHEANNPSHVIALSLPLLRRAWLDAVELVPTELVDDARVGGLPLASMQEEVPAMLDRIKASSDRLSRLLREIQGFADDAAASETFDVTELVEEALSLSRTSLKHRGVTSTYDRPTDPALVCAPKRTLEQILLHLVLEAAQSAQSVQIATRCDDRTVSIEILPAAHDAETSRSIRLVRYAAPLCGAAFRVEDGVLRLTLPRSVA